MNLKLRVFNEKDHYRAGFIVTSRVARPIPFLKPFVKFVFAVCSQILQEEDTIPRILKMSKNRVTFLWVIEPIDLNRGYTEHF